MSKLKMGNHIKDNEFFDFMNKKYKKELVNAVLEKRYVRTSGMQGTGKTTALVEFAKENGHNVIVADNATAWKLREQFDYKRIYSLKSYRYVPMSQTAVVDEGVYFKKFCNPRYQIVTGFMSLALSEEDIKNIEYIIN